MEELRAGAEDDFFCDRIGYKTYFAPYYHYAAVPRPCDCESLATQLYGCDAAFAAHIPEPTGPVAGDRSKFRLFGGVPRYPLDASGVSS